MNVRTPLPRRRRQVSPANALAAAALFFALGGSALAVGEKVGSDTAQSQRACSQGNVRGVAHVIGVTNVPGSFSGAGALFGRKFNCTGRAIHVRRLGIGSYEVRFVGNPAPNAVASGGVGVQASAERIAPGIYRVGVYPSGRADPADFPFLVTLV